MIIMAIMVIMVIMAIVIITIMLMHCALSELPWRILPRELWLTLPFASSASSSTA